MGWQNGPGQNWQGRPNPGRPGRGDRNNGNNSTDRNERMVGMLRGMDANGNGVLEPNEIPEQRRGFVTMMVTRMGGNPNGNINLNALARQNSSPTNRSNPVNPWSPQPRRNNATNAAASLSVATDPLVPYFGETTEAASPVPAFGQRAAATLAAATTQNTAPVLSQSDQILRSARDIMNRYDKNKNGTLDKDKGEWASNLPFKPDAADTNIDGRISMTEIIASLGGKSGVTTGAAAVSTRQSTAYERIPAGLPPWFFDRDKDQDGQLTMTEYAVGQPWTEALVGEFEFLDRNGDGVAIATEIFASLQEFDQQKLLQEEQARREVARRKGLPAAGGAAVTSMNNDAGENRAPEPEAATEATEKPDAQTGPKALPTTGPYAEGSGSSSNNRDRRRGGRRP